jgi:hypothetical protein
MTIKEFAAEKGITTQSVYKRLQSRNISVCQVTDRSTKEITGEGSAILYQLFQPKQPTNPVNPDAVATGEKVANMDNTRLKTLEEENQRLSRDLEIAKLKIEYLQRENELLTGTLQTERALFQPKLTGSTEPAKEGLFRRAFGKLFGKGQSQPQQETHQDADEPTNE